jgi:RNA polymerase sigma factor (sigma-70 family)
MAVFKRFPVHSLAEITVRVNSVSTQQELPSPTGFEEFYRGCYRLLVRDIIFAGGKPEEAEDAASTAMMEVLQRWETIHNPLGYARRAAISNLINQKQRGLQRIQERLIQRGEVSPEHDLDSGLTIWEQREWVTLLLKSLPPAQREVLACMVDMLPPREIAQRLGKTETAVRQNLYAARKRLTHRLAEIDVAEET